MKNLKDYFTGPEWADFRAWFGLSAESYLDKCRADREYLDQFEADLRSPTYREFGEHKAKALAAYEAAYARAVADGFAPPAYPEG